MSTFASERKSAGKHLHGEKQHLFSDEHLGFTDEYFQSCLSPQAYNDLLNYPYGEPNYKWLEKLKRTDQSAYRNLELIRSNAQTVMGMRTLYHIQEKSFPYLLRMSTTRAPINYLGQAQGGGGKTIAFVLGMLINTNKENSQTQSLCLGLTRELAFQIYKDALEPLSRGMEFRTKLLLPGMDIHREDTTPYQIIIGSPGKVESYVTDGRIDLRHLQTFVVDEADEVGLQGGALADSVVKIKKFIPDTCQYLMFSATFTEEIKKYIYTVIYFCHY